MAWNFLRAGQSAEHVQRSTQGLRRDLSAVKAAGTDPTVAAHCYLMWVEAAESMLRSLYSDQLIPRHLQSDRYWRIREIADGTPRPFPLIYAEVDEQLAFVDELLSQLTHYTELMQGGSDELAILLDTNVLVHGTSIEMVKWHTEFGAQSATLIIPVVVIDELDRLKDGKERKARTPLNAIDKLLKPSNALTRTTIRPKVTLQVIDEPPNHERSARVDDEIVRQAAYLATLAGRELLLLTRDRGMRVRAETADIRVQMLPAHLERSKDGSDDQ